MMSWDSRSRWDPGIKILVSLLLLTVPLVQGQENGTAKALDVFGELDKASMGLYDPLEVMHRSRSRLCHCRLNEVCDLNNRGEGKCEDGCDLLFGGAYCSFVKMLGHVHVANLDVKVTLGPLLDSNERTCYMPEDNTLTLEFEKEFSFFNLYIVNSYDGHKNTNMTLKLFRAGEEVLSFPGGDHDDLIQVLAYKRKKGSKEGYKQGFVVPRVMIGDPLLIYDKIEVSNLPSAACIFDLSLGRNLAYKPQAKDMKDPSGYNAVDGSLKSSTDDVCYLSVPRGTVGKAPQHYTVELAFPAVVNYLVYWTLMESIRARCRMAYATITYFDGDGLQVLTHTVDSSEYRGKPAMLPWENAIYLTGRHVSRITFEANMSSEALLEFCTYEAAPSIDICEVFVIGESMPVESTNASNIPNTCPFHWFGVECQASCHYCKESCDIQGDCSGGCASDYWGPDCRTPCSDFCDKKGCVTSNGWCHGCLDGHWGDMCDSSCDEHCMRCSKISGICEVCKQGHYGQGCNSTCGHCKNDTCDGDTGVCEIGCKNGYYGSKCEQNCPGSCFEGKCDISGDCMHGCNDGYYGKKCEKSCGHCADDTCDQTTGKCPKCDKGWSGPKCSKKSGNSHSSDSDGDDGGGGVIMVIILVIILLVLLAVVLFILKKKKDAAQHPAKGQLGGSGEDVSAEEVMQDGVVVRVPKAKKFKATFETISPGETTIY